MSDSDIIRDLWICTDCVRVLGRGAQTAEETAAAERMSAHWPNHELAETSGEGSFTHSRCDGCEAPGGHTLYPAAAIPHTHFGSAYKTGTRITAQPVPTGKERET
jgi:hypothetical protein